jgi:hypothetical protein
MIGNEFKAQGQFSTEFWAEVIGHGKGPAALSGRAFPVDLSY